MLYAYGMRMKKLIGTEVHRREVNCGCKVSVAVGKTTGVRICHKN